MTERELLALVYPLIWLALGLCIFWTLASTTKVSNELGQSQQGFIRRFSRNFVVNTSAFIILAPIVFMIEYAVVFDMSYRVLNQADNGDLFRWGAVNIVIAGSMLFYILNGSKKEVEGRMVILGPLVLVFLSVVIVAFGAWLAPDWMSRLTMYALLENTTDLGAAMIFVACCVGFVLWFFDWLAF